MKPIKVYVAHPYTLGSQGQNVAHSIEVADELRARGFLPFCPLLFHFWDMIKPHNYEYWMSMCIDLLLECDIMVRLPGESKGVDREEATAKNYGIPVFYGTESLYAFIGGKNTLNQNASTIDAGFEDQDNESDSD